MFNYYWGKENHSLYQGPRYIEVHYIGPGSACYRRYSTVLFKRRIQLRLNAQCYFIECVGPQKNLGNVRGRKNGNRVALGTRLRSSGSLLKL